MSTTDPKQNKAKEKHNNTYHKFCICQLSKCREPRIKKQQRLSRCSGSSLIVLGSKPKFKPTNKKESL